MVVLNTTQAIIHFIEAIGTGGVLAILLGSTGIGGLVTGIIAWRKQPIERKDADLAAAEKSQTMSFALAAELRTELSRMGARVEKLEAKLEDETRHRQNLECEVRQQRDVNYQLRVLIARAQDVWDNIVKNWETIRHQAAPPAFPRLDVEV